MTFLVVSPCADILSKFTSKILGLTLASADGLRLPVTAAGLEYLPSLSLNNPFPTDRPLILSNVQAPWEVAAVFAGNTTQVDPVVIVNIDTGGFLALINQATVPGDSIDDRGVTTAQFIVNWASMVLDGTWLAKARDPNPPDGATGVTSPLLGWAAGNTAKFHDVYLGTDQSAVTNATSSDPMGPAEVYKARQPLAWAMWFEMAGWTANQTYYWRIDEVEADGATIHKSDVWSFTAAPVTAYEPDPPDGAQNVPSDKQLSWTPGSTAITHDVYLGTDETAVTDGTGGTFKGNHSTAMYLPGTLAKGTKYYWRIDEVEQNITIKHTGEVWSFRTIPDIPITDPDLVGWWKLDEGSGTMAIDWSGHDNHGTLQGNPQWVVQGYDGGALDFDGTGDWVTTGIMPADYGLDGGSPKTVTSWVYTKGFNNGGIYDMGSQTDGQEFCLRTMTAVNNWRVQRWGYPTYDFDVTYPTLNEWVHFAQVYDGAGLTTLYADGVSIGTQNVTLDTANAEFVIGRYGASTGFIGIIDDLRLFSKALTQAEVKETMRGDPTLAWNPNPVNGSMPDIEHAEPVTWSPGDNAVKHDVYFGMDEDAVIDADSSDTTGVYRGRIDPNSYTPSEGVQVNKTYYWRIDEFNNDATISRGRIWTYTVVDYLIIDNFEDYDDYCNRIFYTYVDGWGHNGDIACGVPASGGNGTGSTVGYLQEPYAEQTIVHGGDQSMPMEFLNDASTGKARYSETQREFQFPQDFTRKGMKSLSLWYQGLPGSVGSFSYDAVPDIYTMTADGWDISGTADGFHYAFKQLSGVGSIQAQVLSVQNTNAWAKAGVMIREDLDPNSTHAMTFVTPGNGVVFEYRPTKGAANVGAAGQETGITAPHWVKITRSGNMFTAEQSANGSTWTTLGTPQNIPMAATVYVGLALTSHTTGATCEATFSNVTVTGTVTGQWQSQDIGIASNAAEQLYVALEDSTGTVKDVPHPNPDAVQLDTWQQWDIDLADFAPVDVTRVKKMYIGVGNRNAPTLGGGGMLYIDDIRLYAPRCFPLLAKPEADFNSNCVVDYPDVEIFAGQWLFEAQQLQDWQQLAAYWDAVYPTAWADALVTQAVRDYLAANGYTVLDAAQLKTWMDARIADGKSSVVVFCQDVVPDTVAETMDDTCTIRKYLDAGGKVVWYSDIPFYYQGHADGTSTTWGTDGSTDVLGFNAAGAGWGSGDAVTIFTAGTNWGLTQPWNSVRPTDAGDVDIVMATDSDGDATAWAKNYVPGDHSRGFVRIADFNVGPGDTALLPDLLSVAESKGPLTGDLNGDGTVDFKDYALLADAFLDEVLWP